MASVLEPNYWNGYSQRAHVVVEIFVILEEELKTLYRRVTGNGDSVEQFGYDEGVQRSGGSFDLTQSRAIHEP